MKHFHIFLTALAALCLVSCTSPKSYLEDLAADINETCPARNDNGTYITSVELTDSAFVIHILEDESDSFTVADAPASSIAWEKAVKLRAIAEDKDLSTQTFYKMLIKGGYSLVTRHEGQRSGTHYDMVITADELKAGAPEGDALDDIIRCCNMDLPQKVGGDYPYTLSSIVRCDTAVFVNYFYDDHTFDFRDLYGIEQQEYERMTTIYDYQTGDCGDTFSRLIDEIIRQRLSLVDRNIGTFSHDTVDIVITPRQLLTDYGYTDTTKKNK